MTRKLGTQPATTPDAGPGPHRCRWTWSQDAAAVTMGLAAGQHGLAINHPNSRCSMLPQPWGPRLPTPLPIGPKTEAGPGLALARRSDPGAAAGGWGGGGSKVMGGTELQGCLGNAFCFPPFSKGSECYSFSDHLIFLFCFVFFFPCLHFYQLEQLHFHSP